MCIFKSLWSPVRKKYQNSKKKVDILKKNDNNRQSAKQLDDRRLREMLCGKLKSNCLEWPWRSRRSTKSWPCGIRVWENRSLTQIVKQGKSLIQGSVRFFIRHVGK